MNISQQIDNAIKEAMRSKDAARLRALRDIKAQILLAKTDGSNAEVDDERLIKIMQKMLKQRTDSHEIFVQQNRPELAEKEAEEMAVIREFLPEMLEGEKLDEILRKIIADCGATSAKDLGKVMGAATKELSGKAEGKAISEAVRRLLS